MRRRQDEYIDGMPNANASMGERLEHIYEVLSRVEEVAERLHDKHLRGWAIGEDFIDETLSDLRVAIAKRKTRVGVIIGREQAIQPVTLRTSNLADAEGF